MYHYMLNVHIYSQHSLLQDAIDEIPALSGFSHKIKTYRQPQHEVPCGCHIAIFDLTPTDSVIEYMKRLKTQGTYTVLCTPWDAFRDSLLTESQPCLDAIWPMPLTAHAIHFYFSKIQRWIQLEKNYHLTEAYLNTTINSLPDLIWFKDKRGAHLKVNDGFCRAVGKEKQDIEGRGHYYIWDLKKEEYEQGEYVCLETEQIVLDKKKTCLFDERVKSKDGMRQLKTYKSPIFDDCGEVIGTVGIARDVTDLGNIYAEQEIILSNLPFPLLVQDSHNHIVNFNTKFAEFFHVSDRNLLIGSDYTQWENFTLQHMTKAETQSYFNATIHSDQLQRILEIHKEPITDIFGDEVGTLCIYRDITLERQFETKILTAANTDYLTNLYNRRHLYDFLTQQRQNCRVSLFYIDLDNFKKVNDTYGHKFGDDALIALSHILRRTFPNEFIARLGGDEFVVIISEECTQEKLEQYAQGLLTAVLSQFSQSNQWNSISASIGIVTDTDSTISIDELLKRGDSALYGAKLQGKNQYCIYSS